MRHVPGSDPGCGRYTYGEDCLAAGEAGVAHASHFGDLFTSPCFCLTKGREICMRYIVAELGE